MPRRGQDDARSRRRPGTALDGMSSGRPAPARTPPASAEQRFAWLDALADAILDAATSLAGILTGRIPAAEAWSAIRDLEHTGDAIARDLFESATGPQSGPVSMEALQSLTSCLDDVLDAIEAAAARLAMHRVRRALPPVREMGQIVLESAQELRRAIGQLRGMHDLFPHTRALHALENRGDDLLRQTIEQLFAGRASAKEIIKWKDICEYLEGATDRCEDIANILETVVVQAGAEDTLVANRLVMDVEDHTVHLDGEEVSLSGKEFDLLHLLLRHLGKIVRRERLLQDVWGEDYFGDTRTLDTHVAWLRKKVEAKGGVRITAVRGVGYRLDPRG
jgi:DNA-binding response OmpR family regulator